MALTKASIKEILSKAGTPAEGMGDAIDAILDGHVTSINALREDVTKYKEDAEKLADVQKELDTLKATHTDEWETKYNAEHEAFEQYKGEIAAEKALSIKKTLYANLLKEQHVDEKRLAAILKVTDFSGMVVKDGKLEDTDKLTEAIKNDWAEFITTDHVGGADVDTPPGNNTAMTKADFEKLPLSKQMEYANANASTVSAFYKNKE